MFILKRIKIILAPSIQVRRNLVSDNRQYTPYELNPKEVLEIWEAKAFISVDFNDPNLESADLSVNELASMVLELKKEVSTLKSSD